VTGLPPVMTCVTVGELELESTHTQHHSVLISIGEQINLGSPPLVTTVY